MLGPDKVLMASVDICLYANAQSVAKIIREGDEYDAVDKGAYCKLAAQKENMLGALLI